MPRNPSDVFVRFGDVPHAPRKHQFRPRAAARLLLLCALLFVAAAAAFSPVALGQQYDPSLYSGMRWRLIGPFRGGRVTAVAGIAGQAAVYYMGTPGGGVWKTTDGGRVWKPIFDAARVASIGALALAPSNPAIIYVGTGEQTEGNGVYKSTDGGATWTQMGLAETHYISSMLVDPRDPNMVLVGSAGQEVFGPTKENPHRGVYKSTDGGKTWKRVLHADDKEKMGVADMCFDPENRRVVYAALWREGFSMPTGKAEAPDSAIYKSSDEGNTWKLISGSGLPTTPMGRIGLAVAPGNKGRRVFAIMNQGLFRSDDAGGTWRRITSDPRITGNLYFSRVFADPRNASVVYVVQTCLYRSTDGGEHFTAFKGAPGGDDYHVLWIDPENSQRMIAGVDQGATISLDGGLTWSSWYNQPTAQLYHVSTDNDFPYHAFAAQQDSGTVAVPNRSDYGEISYRDWFSVGGFELGYITADPSDPNTIYSEGWYSTIVEFHKQTGQINFVFVPSEKDHMPPDIPIVFSPQDPHTMYIASQYLLKSTNRGGAWQQASPDLTVIPGKEMEKPQKNGPRTIQFVPHAAITSIAMSPAVTGQTWAGTSNGLIQLTTDNGATWHEVTPHGLAEKKSIAAIEASHHDPATAYAVIQGRRFALGLPSDTDPHIYRSHDFGKTWQEVVAGLPAGQIVRVVREDPLRKGLLYAGMESGVYVSFDDADHWQSLQLNLPTASVRDLAIHGNDLVAATFGRALWVLDDLTPLRQASSEIAGSDAYLFQPQTAMRVRWDNDQETPLPPEVPAGQNPPDGAIIDYYLKSPPAGEITMAIYDQRGNEIRRFSSTPPRPDTSIGNAPDYWFAPPPVLSRNAGLNRFVWNLRYADPQVLAYGYFGGKLDYIEYTLVDHSILGATPRHQPEGALAVPGRYEVALTVNGKTYRQPFSVALDPRVHVSQADLEAQLHLANELSSWMAATYGSWNQINALQSALAERQKNLAAAPLKEAKDAVEALQKKTDAVQDGSPDSPGLGPLNRDFTRVFTMIEEGDARPPQSARTAALEGCQVLQKGIAAWQALNSQDVPAANAVLEKYKVAPLPIVAGSAADPPCPNE